MAVSNTDIAIADGVRLELLPFLRDTILAREAKMITASSNSVGGWKSSGNIFAWPELEIAVLHDEFANRMGDPNLFGWAMVNRAGSQHKRHSHGRTRPVGVYYVTAGDPPIPTAIECAEGIVGVRPIPGRIVTFPGDAYHFVPRYDGGQPRITIAFELRP